MDLGAITIPPWKVIRIRYRMPIAIALTAVHTGFLVWACVASFTYVGCLENQLLCPQSQLTIPGIDPFSIPTELPLFLLIIISSAVNISYLFAVTKLHWTHFIAPLFCLALFLFSTFLVSTTIQVEQAIIEELNRQGIQ